MKLAIALLGTDQNCTRTKLQEEKNFKKTKFNKDKIQQRQNCTERQFCTRGLNCTETILRGGHFCTIEENSYKKKDVLIENQKENMLLTEVKVGVTVIEK